MNFFLNAQMFQQNLNYGKKKKKESKLDSVNRSLTNIR